jgi:hypothetical protein
MIRESDRVGRITAGANAEAETRSGRSHRGILTGSYENL